jgi:uncharacterized protein YndB with AHSA1/START domain
MVIAEQGRNIMTVTVKRSFTASPESVFDAWLDPERARRFLFTHPGKQEIVRADIDARVGGKYLFVARRNGKDSDHFGEYLEIDRPRRLVFTLCVPAAWSETSRVQIDIVPVESGCEVTLMHEGVLDELATAVEEGWRTFINLLHSQIVEATSQAVAK